MSTEGLIDTTQHKPTENVVLEVQNLQKRYGKDGPLAIKNISLSVREREFVSIVGPSGGGKTTLLKCICHLIEPSSGQVVLHGRRVTSPPPEMVLVFQDYSRSLFPWHTVHGNVVFPLKKEKSLGKSEKEQRAREAIEAVGLTEFAKHYPWQLSGGMQQRVAIARSVAFRPEILLLDEPFASVDALTREGLEDLVLQLRAKFGITVLLVTHDIDEAVYLADRVFVLGSAPSVVVQEILVDLPHPREQTETRSHPRFLKHRNEIHELITGRLSKNGAEPTTSSTVPRDEDEGA
jgi:NitT/TauT family transport system ATP-binding protein